MNKIIKAKITRITNFLLNQGCTLKTKALTCSTYLQLEDVELRISDHFGHEFHDVDIIVPFKGSGYVVLMDHTVITYQEFKDLKVFLENYCLFKTIGQKYLSKKTEKKNEILNESVNQLTNRIHTLKTQLNELATNESRNKLKQQISKQTSTIDKQTNEITRLKQELSSTVDLVTSYKTQLDNAKDAIAQQRSAFENNEQVEFFKTKLEAEKQTNIKLMSELTELRKRHEKSTDKICNLTKQLIVEKPDGLDFDIEFDDFTLNINDFPPAYKEQIFNFVKKMNNQQITSEKDK